jgi:hypothetical protein
MFTRRGGSSPNLRPRQSGALHFGISHSSMTFAIQLATPLRTPIHSHGFTASDEFVNLGLVNLDPQAGPGRNIDDILFNL